MNGNEIPELIASAAPTRNRRKRRKGIPTRVEPTVIHHNDSSSDSDSMPPFLLPNSPARMTPSGGSDHGGYGHARTKTPPADSGTPLEGKTSTTSDGVPQLSSETRPEKSSKLAPRRRSSVSNKSSSKASSSNKGTTHPLSVQDGTVSGMVFGYTKVTSSITTTSRGAKRVKLVVYMCNFCNFKTNDNAVFWEHSVQHLFTCPHCPFKAFTRQHLVSHMEKEHPGQVPEEYINIAEIAVIDMRVTRNITSDPPPPGRGARMETTAIMSPGGDDGHGSGSEVPPKLMNQKSPGKLKNADRIPPKAHAGQKQSDLKFRCDFCPYVTSIFAAFMTHQKEHNVEAEKKTRDSPSSGKLKSLLVGRSVSPPPAPKTEPLPAPASKGKPGPSSAQKPSQPAKTSLMPVLKVPQPSSKSSASSQETSLSVDSLLKNELSKHAKCPICNFVLRSLSELEAHIHLCHQSRLTVTGSSTSDSCKNGSDDYTWCCIYCTAKSDTKLGVVTHIKANHPGEKIRVWRWANKPGSLQAQAESSNSANANSTTPKVKIEPPSQPSDSNEDSSLILKQIVSSTIDNVYGSMHFDTQGSSLSLSKPVLSSQSLLKIPDVTNTSDIMEGKCAITVRKVTPSSAPRTMRSLITGGLVTSPGKSITTTVSPISSSASPSLKPSVKSSLAAGSKKTSTPVPSDSTPDMCLQPPLLTPSYLDMLPDSSETQEFEMDLSMKSSKAPKDDIFKVEPRSPASDCSNDTEFKTMVMKDRDELSDELNSLDVDVQVRKESLIPSEHISYDEDLRLHCCRHCTYQTRSYGHIVDHISTHTGMKTWSCTYCSYRSNRRHDLLRHVQKNHPGSKLKMIRNVPYSNKFSYPLKMSQRVSVARSMVAKKKLSFPPGKRLHQLHSQKLLKKSLQVRRPSTGGLSPTKAKSPTKVDKWQPPATVEFWECPVCARRGCMDVMENHIPIVHPEKIRKRITKKEVMAPSPEHLLDSATLTEKRNLAVEMVPLQKMPLPSQNPQEVSLLKGLPEKLAMTPEILAEYKKVEEKDLLLGKELEEQRQKETKEELSWLSELNNQQSDSESHEDVRSKIGAEEYRCQYCTFSDQSLYVIRKHLIWNHPELLLKCVDVRAKLSHSPRVVHMCHCCTFHSVSAADLLGHYSRNPKHGPQTESDNNNTSSDDELPVLEPACNDRSSAEMDNDDSLPALEKSSEKVDKKVPGKFLSRPLGTNKPSRRVALKRVTKASKSFLKFIHGTQLQCRYCKDFKMYDATIMKDHLLTEHSGQPAIAIDIRSRELRRTSRVFFCPILECNFTEYGPDALVKHLNKAHPDTAFDALIIQICPKESRAEKNTSLNSTSNSTLNSSLNSSLPEVEPKPKPKSQSKKEHSKREKKVVEQVDDDSLQTGGKMPKTTAELTLRNRYWCAYCSAHSSSIDKVKSHFLENHIESKAQLIDARARVLRKKSRLFFCWNVTCNFTTFLEHQATLHEQSQSCLNNFAPDEYESSKVESHSSGFSSPARTPEYSEPNSGSRMFQCLYCSLMTSSRVNMLSHMAAEHACMSGGFSEISTEFNKDGDIVMNVGGGDDPSDKIDD